MAKLTRPAGKSKPKAKAKAGGAARRNRGGGGMQNATLGQLRGVTGDGPVGGGGMNMMPQMGGGMARFGGMMQPQQGRPMAPGGYGAGVGPGMQMGGGGMPPPMGTMYRPPMGGPSMPPSGMQQLPRFPSGMGTGGYGTVAPGNLGSMGSQPTAPRQQYPYPGTPPTSMGPM